MRVRFFAALVASCAMSTAACHSHDDDTYDALEDCVEDHVTEGLTEVQGIVHCLVDYPFGDGLTTEAECVAYVTDNGGYADSRDEACVAFIEETGQ